MKNIKNKKNNLIKKNYYFFEYYENGFLINYIILDNNIKEKQKNYTNINFNLKFCLSK